MLVQKLKIGSFFDFSKSDSPPHQPTTTIGQQINIPVMDHEFAKSITESISKQLQHQKDQIISSFQDKHAKYSELTHSIDLVLRNTLPIVMAYYSFIATVLRDKPSSGLDDNLKKPLHMLVTIPLFSEKENDYSSVSLLITEIQANINSVFGGSTEELSLHFSNIQKLIELRILISTTTDESKLSKDTFDILFQAIQSPIYLLSFMAGNWSMLRLSMKFLLSASKPTRKSANK